MMTSPSNQVWEEREQLRQKLWPMLSLEAKMNPIEDDGRGVIELDTECLDNHKKFSVVQWSRLTMFDWDVKEKGTGALLADEIPVVLDRINILVAQRGVGFRMYRTPGGYRGFLTNRTLNVEEWVKTCNYLHVDMLYMQFFLRKKSGLQPGWACRTSPKPDREGDFVARLLFQTGATSDELAPYIRLHDSLVERFHN